MDASLNTEPIRTRQGKAAKAIRPKRKTEREVGLAKHKAKVDTEFAKAKERLYPIIYRKEDGAIKIRPSQASLDLMAHSPGILTTDQVEQEMWGLLCLRFDKHGLVNHRVVRDVDVRLKLIGELLEEALQEGSIETITRVSWMSMTLSSAVRQTEKTAFAAHNRRRAAKQQSKRAAA